MTSDELKTGLAAVDWSSLGHAYGDASDVPKNLLALTSDDPAVWVEALDSLNWTIIHQGTVYSSTPHAVPLLINLATSPAVKCRARILELLAYLSRGSSYIAAHRDLAHNKHWHEEPDYQLQLARELEWVKATREAVWEGRSTYIKLLKHEDRRVRIAAIYAVGSLAQDRFPRDELQRLAKSLREQFDIESHHLLRAGILFALADYVAWDQSALQIYEQTLADPQSRQEELAAALQTSRFENAPSERSIEALVQTLIDWDLSDEIFSTGESSTEARHHPLYRAYEAAGNPIVPTVGDDYAGDDVGAEEDFGFPFVDGRIQHNVIHLLSKLDQSWVDKLFPGYRVALNHVSEYTYDVVAEPILDQLFGNFTITATTRRAHLDPYQCEALEILYANTSLFNSNNGAIIQAMEKFGLSTQRAQWARVLDKPGWRTDTRDQIIDNLRRNLATARLDSDSQELTPSDIEFGEVEVLNLDDTPEANRYLPHLGLFPRLRILRLCRCEVTDDGLAKLPALPNLEELYLFDNPLTDTAVDRLCNLSSLKILYINKTGIGDEGVSKVVGKLPCLQKLSLNGIQITDAVVSELSQARGLEELDISLTGLSDTSVETLRAQLGNCTVRNWKPRSS